MTSSLPSYPYLVLHMDVVGGDSPAGGSVERVVNFNFYDLVEKRRVTMEEQRIPESIYLSRNIGSSRGWMIRLNNKDLSVHVTNMLNPSVPKSARKVISLPPLIPLHHSLDPSESTPLTELVRSVSLSSSPDQEDCIVAIKFWGSCISFCRRSRSDDDSSWSWSHINSLPSNCEASSLMYSNTASIFYITPSTARTDGDQSQKFEQYEHKDKHGFPLLACFMQLGPLEPPGKLSDSELKLLIGCSGGHSRFLVETPSGDIFTIMRYTQTVKKLISFCRNESDVYELETKRFELYKHDISKGAESYVTDIGDLCIFFGKNEPFCIPASVYPGLMPNSIYFTEKTHVSVYDIATHNIDQLPHQDHLPTPFWLPPILHNVVVPTFPSLTNLLQIHSTTVSPVVVLLSLPSHRTPLSIGFKWLSIIQTKTKALYRPKALLISNPEINKALKLHQTLDEYHQKVPPTTPSCRRDDLLA